MDADFGAINEPAALARSLERVPGIVEHGLFLAETVAQVVVASADGEVRELTRLSGRGND